MISVKKPKLYDTKGYIIPVQLDMSVYFLHVPYKLSIHICISGSSLYVAVSLMLILLQAFRRKEHVFQYSFFPTLSISCFRVSPVLLCSNRSISFLTPSIHLSLGLRCGVISIVRHFLWPPVTVRSHNMFRTLKSPALRYRSDICT